MFSSFFRGKKPAPEETDPIPSAVQPVPVDSGFEVLENVAGPADPSSLYPAFNRFGLQPQQSLEGYSPMQALQGVPFKLAAGTVSQRSIETFQIHEIEARMKRNLAMPALWNYEFRVERNVLLSD